MSYETGFWSLLLVCKILDFLYFGGGTGEGVMARGRSARREKCKV